MTSVRAGRWRKWRGGDDECDKAEITSVTKQRWRVRGSGVYEQAWEEMTKGTKRRWRVWGSSGHEQAWAEMTKESLVRWCRVMRKVYEWDPVGCMGEIPQQLWARRRGAAELISTNPQPSPCVMWNKTGWKSVIIKVDSWQQRRLWIMWIVNIANFTLKLMSGQLIAELTLILSTNYHFSTIFLCLMTGKN